LSPKNRAGRQRLSRPFLSLVKHLMRARHVKFAAGMLLLLAARAAVAAMRREMPSRSPIRHELEVMGNWNHVAAILIGGPAIGTAPRGRYHLYGAIDPRLPVGSVAGY
jgi:hypothetical protein